MKMIQIKNNRNYHYLSLLVTSVTLLMCVSCKQAPEEESLATIQENKIQRVEVISAEERSFTSESMVTGTAMPNQKVMIHAMESGYLQNIRKDIGDKVNKGDVIAVLKNPVISQLVADANAKLFFAQAELTTLKAEIKGAQALAKSKQSFFDRLKGIYEQTPELTPLAELEKAESEAESALAMEAITKSNLAAQHLKIVGLQKDVEIANSRKAALTIRAPFNGIIAQRYTDNGAMIQSGLQNSDAGALVSLVDVHTIRVVLPIPESDAAGIKKGTAVSVHFPALSGNDIEAAVTRTAASLDPKSKTMQVEIDINNKDGRILSGMYAKVLLKNESRQGVLSLPQSTQFMYKDEPFIYVVEDGIVKRIALRKGLENKEYFEVLNAEIDKITNVVITGKGLIKNGQSVEAVSK